MGFRIRRSGHIVIRCADVQRSRAFFEKVVGLTQHGSGARDMYFMTSDFERNHHMVLVRPAPGGGPRPEADRQIGLAAASFELVSFDALKNLYKRLADWGARIARTEDRGAVKALFVYDPDGNLFEFYCREPGTSPALADHAVVLGTLDAALAGAAPAEA